MGLDRRYATRELRLGLMHLWLYHLAAAPNNHNGILACLRRLAPRGAGAGGGGGGGVHYLSPAFQYRNNHLGQRLTSSWPPKYSRVGKMLFSGKRVVPRDHTVQLVTQFWKYRRNGGC